MNVNLIIAGYEHKHPFGALVLCCPAMSLSVVSVPVEKLPQLLELLGCCLLCYLVLLVEIKLGETAKEDENTN